MILPASAALLAGCWLVYTGSFPIMGLRTMEAVRLHKVYGGLSGWWNSAITRLGRLLEPRIPLSEYRQSEYARYLKIARSSRTPKEFLAFLGARAMVCTALGLLLFPLHWAFPFLFGGYGVYLFQSDLASLKRNYMRRRDQMEMDLPKLCSVINSRLKSTQNVCSILESFLPIASPATRDELAVTVADMKTGSEQGALLRLEQRISSPMVSDVVRGLISVLSGDDQVVYFATKQIQFNSETITRKLKDIRSRPAKLHFPEFLMFGLGLLILLYPLWFGLTDAIGGIL